MAKNKATAKRSNFATHEQTIAGGSRKALEGWLNAAVECRDKWNSNRSAYASASKTDYTAMHTIRNYVGDCLIVMGKVGRDCVAQDVIEHLEFEVGYGYANIDDLRSYARSLSKRKTADKPSRKEKKQSVTSRKVRSACGKAGLSAKQTEQVLEALGF